MRTTDGRVNNYDGDDITLGNKLKQIGAKIDLHNA
jgi:hypothetical protein